MDQSSQHHPDSFFAMLKTLFIPGALLMTTILAARTDKYSEKKETAGAIKKTRSAGESSLAAAMPSSCNWLATRDSNPPVYWINMNENLHRKAYMERLLTDLQYQYRVRVSAVTPELPTFKIAQLEQPCKRNTKKDLAVVMSHLTAIYTAVYGGNGGVGGVGGRMRDTSRYALILEDDVRQLHQLNYTALISSAPEGFGVLQLMTSNVEAIQKLWSSYQESSGKGYWTYHDWSDTTKNKRYPLYWSALAYLIDKTVVKNFIDQVVVRNSSSGLLEFRLVNSFSADSCKFVPSRPCVLAHCLFADTYIYSGAGPTYVSNIPLFTGATVGYDSTVHQDQVPVHKAGFHWVQKVTYQLKSTTMQKKLPIPPYIVDIKCDMPIPTIDKKS